VIPSSGTGGLFASSARERVRLGDVLVDRIGLRAATHRMRQFLEGGSHQVVTVNLDFIRLAAQDDAFRATINAADLAVADGIATVWLSRLAGRAVPERVAGVELVEVCCRIAAQAGRAVFFFGAAEAASAAAAERLRGRIPGLRVDRYSPPFGPLTESEDRRVVQMIRDSAPAFLFVALGAPRQDLWIRERLGELRVPVAMGVGCSVDLLAGRVRRAPVALQRVGLEWAFRLAQEPRRLWRRYLVRDLPFLAHLLLSRSGRALHQGGSASE
jgi:N-acetylglucosaminyldiphosphoundecaprenol N-acetyl-beta-D-mannosaminyltransferase